MYLLDTHTLFWLDTEPQRLSIWALKIVKSPAVPIYASSVNAWELSIKYRLGKLPNAKTLLNSYHSSLARYGFIDLEFNSHHALAEGSLQSIHKDPFDRALVAQARVENLTLVTNDKVIQSFAEIKTTW